MGKWLDVITNEENGDLSSSTVFFPDKLPDGSPHRLCGKHDEEHRKKTGRCHCQDRFLQYARDEPWGCMWYKEYKVNVEKLLALGQHPVIVYQDWRHGNAKATLLGGSQQGEERYLKELKAQGRIQELRVYRDYLDVVDL